MYTKRYIIDLKIRPYFEKKILSEITARQMYCFFRADLERRDLRHMRDLSLC